MGFLAAVWSFARSPVGRYVAITLAMILALFAIRQCGYSAGEKHQADRDRGASELLQAQLTTCRNNTTALQSSLSAQNTAVDQMKADSDKRLQAASDALQGAQKGRESAEARAAKLVALKPAGVDACARVMSADAAVLENLK